MKAGEFGAFKEVACCKIAITLIVGAAALSEWSMSLIA